jgi:NADH-quinone oxidoreductase subunit A
MDSTHFPENYIPIVLFIVAAFAFGAISYYAAALIRPARPYRAKLAPYESGSPLFSDARIQFPMRYYIIAMLFVIFDIEVIFMVPWAVRYQSLGLLGLIEMMVFIAILLAGFWYAWKKGALDWD